jgi:hypothetical protein
MLLVERSFFSLRRPRGDDAIQAVSLGKDDNQYTPCVCLAEMHGPGFAISQHSWGVERIILNYLFRLFRGNAMTGNMLNVR